MTDTHTAHTTEQQPTNTKKEQLYRFGELSKEAKTVAINQVFEIERERPQDFESDYLNVHEHMQEILTESGLNVNEGISWEYQYGKVDIDFSNVSVTEAFIKSHLSEKEYTLFTELDETTDFTIERHLFHKMHNQEGFTFELSGYYHLDEESALQMLAFYSENEDILVKYRLPALFLENDTSGNFDFDDYEDLHDDFETLAERFLESFSETISEHVEALATKCRNVVTDLDSYLGSELYYKDELEAEAYEEQIYRFNQAGQVIMRDELFVEESDALLYEKYQEKY